MMAAVNVALTKTLNSTTVIFSVLSDTARFTVIMVASFTYFLLTIQVSLIYTQRSRSVSLGESPSVSVSVGEAFS